jgi:hypothetical protein
MLAQTRAGVRHHGLARLQQQAGQIAMQKSGDHAKLFNLLNFCQVGVS